MKTITYDETKWKLVPMEPTDAMALAAIKVGLRNPAINGVVQYKAMLAAAPTPPASEQAQQDADIGNPTSGNAQPDPAMAGDALSHALEHCGVKRAVAGGAWFSSFGLQQLADLLARKRVQPASAEDARDAARYRWLRDQNASLELNTFYVGIHREGDEPAWIGSDLDEAVDAAMQQEGQS